MKRILIVASNDVGARELDSGLTQMGFACSTTNSADTAVETVKREALI